MLDRLTSGALLLVSISLPIIGCTTSQVDSLQVSPTIVTMSAGATAQLTATGIYHHGSGPSTSQDLTSQVTWKTTSADVATVSASGLVTGVGAGTITITATINGYTGELSASSSVTVTANNSGGGGSGSNVVSVSIIPGAQSVAVGGETGQYIAIGTTSGGNQVNLTDSATWTSSNVSVATVSSHGLATAVGAGSTTITAIATNSDQTVASGTATFTVTGATAGPLLSISIIPDAQTMIAGQTSQLIAIGAFNVAPSTQNITSSVTWATSNSAVASISAGGLLTATGPGVCAITAIGTNAGGGVVTATSTFTVTGSSSSAEPLASLAIVPNSQTALAVNQTAHFIAIATTGTGNTVNLTNQSATVGGATIAAAVWSSSNPTVATIDPATGVATALSAGTTAITAQASNPDATVVLATATFTVTIPTVAEPLVSMAIVPATQTLAAAGQTANLTAIATTGSGTTVNLTNKTALVGTTTIQAAVWASSSPAVASVDPATGVVTANGSGVAVITAIATNPGDGTVVTATATITSTAVNTTGGAIASIDVIPGDQSVASPNDTTQFLAIGTSTTGATVNITSQVTWSSSSTQIATVGANTGYATAVGKGSATITALFTPASGNVVTGTAAFTVTGGTLETYVSPLTILPASQTIGSGVTTQFIALATLGSTGEVVDVTDSKQITWSVADSSIATVSNYPANPAGVVTGQSAGTTTITAELSNGADGTVITSTSSITVTTAPPPEEILTLTIYPSTITVLDFNLTGQFLAIGTFSQPPYVRDLTNAPTTTWLSSEPESFPVGQSSLGSGGNNGASAGLVTAYSSGGADIIAESTSKDGTIQVAQATFACPEVIPGPGVTTPSCYPNEPPAAELLATVTVFNEGLNTTDWEVTGPSATGTPNVIHCGPGWALNGGTGGSVCTGTYPMIAKTPAGTPGVVLEGQGAAFGGWSYNCIPSDSKGNYLPGPVYWTAAGPNYCVATLDSSYVDTNGDTVVVPGIDTTIGAIFN